MFLLLSKNLCLKTQKWRYLQLSCLVKFVASNGKGKFVPARHEGIDWIRGIARHILNFGTRWRWVICFTAWPLHLRGRSPYNHRTGGWVGPISLLDTSEKRHLLPLSWIQPLFVCCPFCGPVCILNEVFRLQKRINGFKLVHKLKCNVLVLTYSMHAAHSSRHLSHQKV
jgi:hypothetical protein